MNIGGPSVHVQLLARGLRDCGYETQIVAGQVEAGEDEMPLAEGVDPPIRCPYLRRQPSLGTDLRALWWCYRLFCKSRPLIVHTHQAKAGFIGRLAAWLAGVPITLHTYHGHTFRGYFSPRRVRRHLRLERWLAKRTTRLIAISPRLRDELVGEFRAAPAEKFEVLQLGLDLEDFYDAQRFRGRLRAQLSIPAQAPLVGIVGRLTNVKNHELFLHAARKVLDHRPDVRFAVIGDGELRAPLRALARELGVDQQVHFVGWQPRSPAIYADLDILALTSRNEGTPVVLIEGMAAGCVCVATAVGGVPDVIDDGSTGFLTAPDDANVLAEKCLAILSDPTRGAKMSQRARHAAHRYDHWRLYRELADLYDGLACYDQAPSA